MTIQSISHTGVALYITPADLKEYGLTPHTLTLERASAIARDAFAAAGIEPAGAIEIEAFPDTCGVLVFARVRAREELCFSFADSESLLRAVSVLAQPPDEGRLNWFDGRYWLSFASPDHRCAAVLSEFGQEAPREAFLSDRLSEYGCTLLQGDVVGALKSYFLQ